MLVKTHAILARRSRGFGSEYRHGRLEKSLRYRQRATAHRDDTRSTRRLNGVSVARRRLANPAREQHRCEGDLSDDEDPTDPAGGPSGGRGSPPGNALLRVEETDRVDGHGASGR